ncbi:polyadenylate-binding protein RBP47-like [Fagus crenata]|jgi:RNA recognition motif-containing protein|uniref:RRM domain-containing protein n=1 Tax=Fagus sylvatica TaxID=28930 RepID=A0A2N9IT91_FAGSY
MAQQTNGGDLTTQQQQQQPQPQQQQWMQQQQQQQWMAMQYPAVAMAMMQQHQQQQMMMYNYVPYAQPHPYHHQQQQQQAQIQHHQNQNQNQKYQNQKQQQQQQLGSTDEAKTIWIGDLHHWMDEAYLHSCFSHTGEVSTVKVIRNKQTGQSEGYGFIEFYSHEIAEKILQSYNGAMMPNTEQPFRLNWATFSAGEKRSDTGGSDLSIFVGDLATDVTDTILQETFATRYPSVKGAKVVFDSNTGRSKGYGFVRFGDENERSRAITEMNGMYCSSRPMRVGVATPKKSSGYQQQYSSQALVLAGGHASNGAITQGSQSDGESSNTTIFVGGLDSDVTDEDLRQPFSQFGEIVSVKIPMKKGCGFVQFANRKNAEDAMQSLNGAVIGKQTVRLSWGRSPASKQWRQDHSNQWNGAQNGGQGYGGYGYAVPQTQGLGMYATAAVHGAS